MTAKELIAKLKKVPGNTRIYLADHDHSYGETNGPASDTHLLELEDAIDPDWDESEKSVFVISV